MTDWTKRHDAQVAFKHSENKTVQQIAKEMGKLATQVVAAHVRLGLKQHPAAPKKPKYPGTGPRLPEADSEQREKDMAACSNAVEAAENTLGSRLTWKGGIRHLDGRVCELGDVMREANRVRKADGRPQLSTNPEWRW